MKAEVIVDDDQLSLSIGKHGQNVRLASRLVGWELDIRTKSMIAAEALGGKDKEKVVAAEETLEIKAPEAKVKKVKKVVKKESKNAIAVLSDLESVSEKILESLKEAKVKSLEDIIKLKVEGLMEIKGIGEKKAEKIFAEAKKLA